MAPLSTPDSTVTPVVLIVDDHRENLVAFEAALAPLVASEGARIVLAESAEEALRHALAEGDHLAVVLLDVMMPGTDGPETARLIRQRRQTAHVPIVFVTALDADRHRLTEAYRSGAVDYLTKPVDPDLLRGKVGAFIDLYRRQAESRSRDRQQFADAARAASERATAEATEARTESAAARARLAAVLDSLPDTVATFDAAWRCVYLNPTATHQLRATGRDPDAVLGRVLWEVAADLLGTRYESEMKRAAAERRVVAFEEHMPSVGLWLDNRAVPGPDGTVTLFARDITPRIAAERERERLLAEAEAARAAAEEARVAAEQAREAAEEANRSKSRFLATMSHELRTPLNAISGHVQLVAMGIHGPVTDAQRAALDRVERAGRHLLALINDVLNYAKLESGRVEYDMRPTRLADVIGGVVSLVEPQLAEKGLALDVATTVSPKGDETHGGNGAPLEVWADADKLGQILINLLSNAQKFTPRGGRVDVRVGVRVCERPTDPELVEVRVSDTGIGVAVDRREAIFEPFVQVRRDLASTHEGTGLGLAISRDLARGMGGDLTVESREGEGSTFTISLRRVTNAGGGPIDRRGGERRGVVPHAS